VQNVFNYLVNKDTVFLSAKDSASPENRGSAAILLDHEQAMNQAQQTIYRSIMVRQVTITILPQFFGFIPTSVKKILKHYKYGE